MYNLLISEKYKGLNLIKRKPYLKCMRYPLYTFEEKITIIVINNDKDDDNDDTTYPWYDRILSVHGYCIHCTPLVSRKGE